MNTNEIRTNKAGLEIIGNAEGCRKDAYLCPAGRWTQGIGSTNNVKKDKIKTDSEIAQDFIFNIKQAEQCLNTYANGKVMPDNVFSAFSSFTFNTGCTKSRKYSVYNLLKEGKYIEACNALPKYVYAKIDGKKVPVHGLVIRREKEKNLCLQDFKI